MIWVLTALLLLMSVAILAEGLWRRGGFYGFPFLAAAMFLLFILPQIPGLAGDRFMPDASLARAVFFSCLCLAMCVVGWWLGVGPHGAPRTAFCEQRLLVYAAFLSAVGAYFFHKFGLLADEERLRGFLSGTSVAYLFFAKLLTYGLAIALLCFARRPSAFALCIILFDCVFYFDRIVIAGRRGDAAEFALLVALAYWFQVRRTVPRALVALSLVFALLGLLTAGEYRAATYYGGTPNWSAVLDIDPARNWRNLLAQGGEEFRNLAISMDYFAETHHYDYGATHWNTLVHSYVPAQIVGSEIKEALYLPPPSESYYPVHYEPSPGSTPTGMMDAFASFSYFGCLKFAFVAALLGAIYSRAMHGQTAMQILYMLSALPAMLVVTHFTNELAIAWVHIAIFILPGLVYARIRPATEQDEPSPEAHLRLAA